MTTKDWFSEDCYFPVFIVLASALLLCNLGAMKMPPIDDCYYAQKAKEILQTGDWLNIHFAGKLSVDNAPLYIWLLAASFKLFGISEFSARIFSAVFGIFTLCGVYTIGRMIFDKWTGFFAAFILLTSLPFFEYSRRTMVDVTLTFWITLSLFAYLKAKEKKTYFLLFGISTGLAILTKSALGVFPLLIAAVNLLLQKKIKLITDPYFLSGIALILLVSTPWYLYQLFQHPHQFFNVHLKWLLYKGAVSRDGHHPLFWYITMLWEQWWPWVPLATISFFVLAYKNIKKPDPDTILLLCWAAVVIGLMSVLKSKKFHYIMASFPALAILTAMCLKDLATKFKAKQTIMKICTVFMLLLTTVAYTAPLHLPPSLDKGKYFQNLVEDTWGMAEFAQNSLPDNSEIVLYNMYLWRIRSTFLFYSDIDIKKSVEGTEALLKTANNKTLYVLTLEDHFKEFQAETNMVFPVLKQTPQMVLFKIQKGDNNQIKQVNSTQTTRTP